MDNCPKCGSDQGYYEKLVMSYDQFFDFSGLPVYASCGNHVKGGKIKRCTTCEKDITKYIEAGAAPNGTKTGGEI